MLVKHDTLAGMASPGSLADTAQKCFVRGSAVVSSRALFALMCFGEKVPISIRRCTVAAGDQ